MTRYERTIQILDNSIGGPDFEIGNHGAFWRGLTRDQFVVKKVKTLDLVILGNGSSSNLVKALKGEAPFGNDLPNPLAGAQYPRMPAFSEPVPDIDIAFIQKWIDDNCPEDEFTPQSNLVSATHWRPTAAPPVTARYDDVWMHDEKLGWAVNSNGQIVHTKDGFDSYVEQLHDDSVYWRCIAFATPLRGWAGTLSKGKILFETSDGGITWTPLTNLPADAPEAACGIWVVNESVIYVAGANQPEKPVRMMKSTDGGKTWVAWSMKKWADNLIDIFFTSPETGWVVGGKSDEPMPTKPNLKPVVLYTEDGGNTWVDRIASMRDQFPLGEWGWKIHFVDASRGFISLQNYDAGAILATEDGGKTWERRIINDPQKNGNLEGIGFIDENIGWVGGWGDRPKQKRTSSATKDGGKTWRDANEIGRTINRFRFLGKPVTIGYSAGETIYRYSADPITDKDVPALQRGLGNNFFGNKRILEKGSQAEVAIRVAEGTTHLRVQIWDQSGAFVRVLHEEAAPSPGDRLIHWDGSDECGRLCPDGHFICRATMDGHSQSQLLMIDRAARRK